MYIITGKNKKVINRKGRAYIVIDIGSFFVPLTKEKENAKLDQIHSTTNPRTLAEN